MKKFALSLTIAAAMATGCAEQKKPTATSPLALDVNPPAQTVTPVAAYTPAASPVLAAPDTVTTQTPSASIAGAGSTYTVKKGDTLFKIAKEHYGDGKQWQKIASANPGVTPQSLRVGQTLNIP